MGRTARRAAAGGGTWAPTRGKGGPGMAGAALTAAALALAACGGGGGGSPSPGTPPGTGTPGPVAPPAAGSPGGILGDADTLVMTALHTRWSLAGAGEPAIEDSDVLPVTCAGATCTDDRDGTATTAAELSAAYRGAGSGAAGAATGARGGFGTVTTDGSLEFAETRDGVALDVSAGAESWGFWGAHGMAALSLGGGPVAATVDGTAYSGGFSMAQAWAAGDATGRNPSGAGSATWTGIAEASPKGTFRRLRGTARVTIPDLSRPRVGVEIDVPGQDIGAPGWADMAVEGGRFDSGDAGTDYLAGSFHGPGHAEAWGVFDTKGHLGAFGARRTR